MDIEITTIGEMRRHLKSKAIQWVFVHCTYSPDDGVYVEASKAAVKRAFKGNPSGETIIASIRASEPDTLYIN